MPLREFLVGPGKTTLAHGELIESVSFVPLEGYGLAFLKLGKRNGMSISIASVAAAITLDESGAIGDVRIAMGSVAPTAVRCAEAEKILIGESFSEEAFERAGGAAAEHISPISDVRASAGYRRATTSALVVRALTIAAGRMQ